jgi:hypothetical protein
MATERDLEQLDDYLSNKMNAGEKTVFEQKLHADSELANELTIQQELIKGIQQARVAELKAMLNNVPVPVVPHAGPTAVLLKFAAGTIIIGAIATGVYFLISDKGDSKTPVVSTPSEVKDDVPVTTSEEQSTEGRSGVKSDQSSADPSNKEQSTNDKTPKQAPQSAAEPKIDVYDPTEDSDATEEAIDQAEAQPGLSGKAEPSVAVTIDKANSTFSFHYQYKEGKLFLYGPFEKDLYEILEFFSNNQRTVFLHYKSDYYLLKEVDQKIRPLNKITDPALIDKLDESRNPK